MLIDQLMRVTESSMVDGAEDVLTPEAMSFIGRMEGEFGARRRMLLKHRADRQEAIDAGQRPDFLHATSWVREKEWQVAPVPADLQDRRIEITGPTDAKMMINALNSNANVFVADLEDANAPTWHNMVLGQANLRQAVAGTLKYQSAEGRDYRLNRTTATLMVRPRGWHMDEHRVSFEGRRIAASFFDAGLFLFHNAQALLERGAGPYLYLPKLEGHLEARLWNEVLDFVERELELPHGSIRVTVLIENILAAFEMEEILYELKDRAAGLNAGRWDYIFSIIKKFRHWSAAVLPDRGQVTMTVPFMRAYTKLLVQTCHTRGVHAIGGMAAFIPSRRDPQVNELTLAKVREDKSREADDGFDGTSVAHPDLVPVAREVFDNVLEDQPHQKDFIEEEISIDSRDLMNFNIPEGKITEAGLRTNIRVGVRYLAAWLGSSGAVAIDNLMEDTATAEICRAQIWQWLHHPDTQLDDGRIITQKLFLSALADEYQALSAGLNGSAGDADRAQRLKDSTDLFEQLSIDAEFPEFLTTSAEQWMAQRNEEVTS